MSDDKRGRIRLSQYGDQAQIAPSLYMSGSVVVGFYNADGSASVPCGCFTPDEWDAFVAAGNRALGREPVADRAEVDALRAKVAELEAATVPRAAVVTLRDRWSAIARELASDVKSDPNLRMIEGASKAMADAVAALNDLLAAPMPVKLDHGAEVEALRARVAELEEVIEEHKHAAWERSERD